MRVVSQALEEIQRLHAEYDEAEAKMKDLLQQQREAQKKKLEARKKALRKRRASQTAAKTY